MTKTVRSNQKPYSSGGRGSSYFILTVVIIIINDRHRKYICVRISEHFLPPKSSNSLRSHEFVYWIICGFEHSLSLARSFTHFKKTVFFFVNFRQASKTKQMLSIILFEGDFLKLHTQQLVECVYILSLTTRKKHNKRNESDRCGLRK